MNWISVAFFTVALLICCTFFRKDSDFLSPSRVFGFTWSVVLALVNLKLSRLQFNWTPIEWVYVLMGPASFLIGLFIAYVMNVGTPLWSIDEMRQKIKTQKINNEKLFYLILFGFFVYFIGYLVIYLVKGYIPIFSLHPAAARNDYFIFGVGLFTHTMPVIVFFSLIYLIFTDNNHSKKWLLKLIMFVTILTYLFLLQRYQLIMVSVLVFTLLYYSTWRIRFRTMVLFIMAGVILIYSVATIRTGKIIQLALYITSEMKFSPRFAFITEPYMYIVMNVENFVHAMSKIDYFSYGAYTFDWFFALIQLKYPIKEYFGFVDNPFLFSGYNTYTFFWTFYRDFGIIGISLIPMGCGLIVGSVYYSMRRNPSIELISFYCVSVFVMVMSFFVNPLGFLWFVYIVAWMVIILKFTRKRADPA